MLSARHFTVKSFKVYLCIQIGIWKGLLAARMIGKIYKILGQISTLPQVFVVVSLKTDPVKNNPITLLTRHSFSSSLKHLKVICQQSHLVQRVANQFKQHGSSSLLESSALKLKAFVACLRDNIPLMPYFINPFCGV